MPITVEEQINSILELEQKNKPFEAKKLCNEFLKNDPQNVCFLRLLGLFENRDKQFPEAIALIKRAIEVAPCVELYTDLAKIYIDKEDFYNAIESCQEAIKMDSSDYDAWLYLAFSLKENNQIDDSIIAYQKALSLNPNSCCVYHNLGSIYDNFKNNPEKAIECYEKFLEYEPENEYAKGCLSTLYLKIKDFKKGWNYFEYSKNKRKNILEKASIPNSPTTTKPLWKGEDISEKTICVYSSGGQGDTIMFSRFLPLLKNKCAKILFRPHKSTINLFKENDLGIEILDENDREEEVEFDYYISLMNLPCHLEINSETDIPFAEGYLRAHPDKVKFYKEKYFNNKEFKIGIQWQGDTTNENTRKIPLKSFYPLFGMPNVKFYSVQVGEGIEQLAEATEYKIVDLGSTFKDFSDTAAAIENLDLLISNDTAVANLAGAMGKECWTVLPFVQDWRWSIDISYCPWYKSLKLFKQTCLDSWDEVFDEVYEALFSNNKVF